MLRALLLSLTLPAVLGLGALAYGCTTDTTTITLPPITGIIVRSESLIAGRGCGTGPTEVYKYAAVVVNADGNNLAGGVYDCFADGVFANLPASDAGSLTFSVYIYAYDQAQYLQDDSNGGTIESAASTPSLGPVPLDGGGLALDSLPATWRTTCAATQQSNIEVLAVCLPLAPEVPPPLTDAGFDAMGDAPTEAATDSPADAPVRDGSTDAPDGSDGGTDGADGDATDASG